MVVYGVLFFHFKMSFICDVLTVDCAELKVGSENIVFRNRIVTRTSGLVYA